MGKEDFVEKFGGIYEHSRWVAEAAFDRHPFGGRSDFAFIFKKIVEESGGERQVELLLAHPDLAGKLAMADLTLDSRREQKGAGLDRLDEEEMRLFKGLNETYRGLFGFPFIICVGRTDKAGILRAFRERISNSREMEIRTAMEEVHAIAELRMGKLIGG